MRKVLEDMIFIGCVKETYKLFNKEWTLKSLTADEIVEASLITRDYDQLSRINAIKVSTLTRSLVALDGEELTDLDEKAKFFSKLQQPVIDIIYNKYIELQKKKKNEIDNLNNEIKN